ncbi:hypothetical protein HN51_047383, partial [Arachis hypogaea]
AATLNFHPPITSRQLKGQSYARDEGCLHELSKIVECKKLKNQQVFPVFYKLEPSHVRHQTSSYELAMETHENKYGKDYVQQFIRSALFEVANLKGWTFKSGVAYEYQTIQKIVELVNKSLARYDVFLSFRGMDTRFTFTGHLYNDLCKKGFKTFMDDDAMKYGEEISSSLAMAIKESRVAVIVFSENYAYSTWTLEELAIILDLTKVKNYHVYPIYYNVNPDNVWNQEGSFGEAMAKHEKRYPEKVQRWRKALSRVQEFDPILLKLDEYDLIERIADKVQECLI